MLKLAPRLKAPGPGVKERKLIIALPPGMAKKIIGAVTEGVDLIDCMHSALPKDKKAKALKKPGKQGGKRFDSYAQAQAYWKGQKFATPSMKRKLAAVYKNFDLLSPHDITMGILECGMQNVMDVMYGQLGKTGAKLARSVGRPTGFGIGGTSMRKVTSTF